LDTAAGVAAVSAGVQAAMAACETGVTSLSDAAARLAGAKAGLVSRLNESLTSYDEVVEAVIAAVKAHQTRLHAAAKATAEARCKALEGQLSALLTSAGQLSAAVGVGRHALAAGDVVVLAHG